MINQEFKDKVAILTGATRGIGRAIALELAQGGAKVAFNYAKSDDEAKSLVKEIRDFGAEAFSYKCDVRDFEKIKKFAQEAIEKLGGLDFLVNNAGILRDKALVMMEKSDWDEVIDTNLTGYFNMARAAIFTLLKQKRGAIVNISSISGISGIARQVNYSASKAGIIGLTKALAKEVAPYNIRVNCVAPGFIETDMTNVMNQELKEKFSESIPFGRFGKAQEVARVVSFLLSEKSNYITGHVIKVDGGLHMSY